MTPAPQTRRINRGAGHSYILDGEPVAGVTSILAEGLPKPALVDWAARETANYAVNNWTELTAEQPAQRLRKLEKSRFVVNREATARGTTVHKYAAALLAGQTVDVPDAYGDVVDRCLDFLRDWQISELAVEATVINRTWGYMGACDLIARVGDDPTVWLFDWKTGRSGVWPDVALQLAAYAHAESMLVGDVERPFPNVERAAAVYLTGDHYDVIPAQIDEPVFRAFLHCMGIAEWRSLPRGEVIGDPLPAPFEAAAS
jgi:hypothetical protein